MSEEIISYENYLEIGKLGDYRNQPNNPPVDPYYWSFPLYGFFKIEGPKNKTKQFRIGTAVYWRPFLSMGGVGDRNYYLYNEGDAAHRIRDEAAYKARGGAGVRNVVAADAYNSGQKESKPMPSAGERYVGAAQGIQATGFVAIDKLRPFPSETAGVLTNPWPSRMIRVFIRDKDANQTEPKEFWWHPFENYFYPFPTKDAFTEWDQFTIDTLLENLARSFGKSTLADASKGTDVALTSAQVSIRNALVQLLIKSGLVRSAAEEQVAGIIAKMKGGETVSAASVVTGAGGAGGTGGGSNVPSGSSPSGGQPNRNTTNNGVTKTVNPLVTTLTIRGGFGFATPSYIDDRNNKQYPQMVQYYSNDVLNKVEPRRFDFKFPPQQIAYSSIGSDWTEIPRAGKTPLVDWQSFRLMKISFQFVIGNADSLDDSIDNELQTLRLMASSPYPVVIFGYDDLFSQKLQYSDTENRIPEFVINDLNFNSIYRNAEQKINRATVDITLAEIPIETISITEMPRISTPIKPLTPGVGTPTYPNVPLLSRTSRTNN